MKSSNQPKGPDRGSRKHVLDWVKVPEFLQELNLLISPSSVFVTTTAGIMPAPSDRKEARLETFLPNPAHIAALQAWWLAAERGANTPNWDLAAIGSLGGRSALVLVEAKGNERELSGAGKARPAGKKGVPPSHNSWRNHSRIGQAIAEAERALNEIEPGFCLSRDHHYQLSNRIAFAWKLASLGLPTVLVYLGFTGDDGIKDAGQPLKDAEHWRNLFWHRANAVVPSGVEGRWLPVGDSGLFLIVASRPCIEQSPEPIRAPRRAAPQ